MTIEHYAGLTFWRSAPNDTRSAVQLILQQLVEENGAALVSTFYEAFLAHEDGRTFLDHDVVQNRLSRSMETWLAQLTHLDMEGDLTEFAATQAHIGAIHGRMKVPNHLVHQGASLLKSHLSTLLVEELADQPRLLAAAIIIFDEMVDFALCLMGKAYVSEARERAQADEAFRHFSLGQDINLERETQRAALLEWSQGALFNLFGGQRNEPPQKLSASSFGLWMRHRAPMLFRDITVLTAMEKAMKAIDTECLPAITTTDDGRHALMRLKERIEEISFLLTSLFQTAATMENGRDPLTRALSRRFLPSVMNREIMMARDHQIPLSVAMIDIDHFKRVNDELGHVGGDLALSHVAELLLKSVRPNDFVFRFGGEEFLVVFPETSADEAMSLMERARQTIEHTPFQAEDSGELRITLSAGVAEFEGHPDYDYLIRNADSALYEAKQAGRNRLSRYK